jgi:hypothetical protein
MRSDEYAMFVHSMQQVSFAPRWPFYQSVRMREGTIYDADGESWLQTIVEILMICNAEICNYLVAPSMNFAQSNY